MKALRLSLRFTTLLLALLLPTGFALASVNYTLQQSQWELIAIPAGLGNENTAALVFGDDIEAASPGAVYTRDWIMWKYGPFGENGAQDYELVDLDEVLDINLGYWIIQVVEPAIDVSLPADAIVAGDLPNGEFDGDTLSWVSDNPGSWIAIRPASSTSLESSRPPSLGIQYIISLVGQFPVRSLNDPLLGEVAMFAGNFAPRGWAFCDGQLLSISENVNLFSLLGIDYGGDGRTTFALPDLRGRAPVHTGQGPGLSNVSRGERFGSERHSHLLVQPQ